MVCYNNGMPRMNIFKKQAFKLRLKGFSYNLIHKKLGVAKSTLSDWFREVPYTPNDQVLKRIKFGPLRSAEKRHNEKVQAITDTRQIGIKEIGKLSKRDLWLLGLGLYIGEGTKSYEIIRIINSNPEVIKLAVHWFKNICCLDEKNITIALHLYPDNNELACIKFWEKVTGLPRTNFRKTQIDRRKDKKAIKKQKLPYGTAHVTIVSNGDSEKGVRLYRKMEGWILGALTQINNAGIV